MGAKDHLDLEQLADKYEVLGELAGREDARSYIGTRRHDNKPILITVSREPAGDAGNALSHLAADTNLLAGLRHRNLVPILEARWIGTDALAVITERVTAPSLDAQLSRREEEFPLPRIASILQQINGTLDWARAQKVVHRGIRLDSVFVEPGSDQVYVLFAPKPLPVTGIPGEQADAQTIASVARAMLTRSVADPERDKLSLAELRPGLPTRVVEQTELLRDPATASAKIPDIRGYIAAIAMADELKRGETESLRITTEMAEEQRVTREALAAERKAHEDDLATQARKFAKEKEDSIRSLEKEKEELLRAVAKEREEMVRTLAKEREEMARSFAKEKDELARAITKERKELQRAVEKERGTLAKERAAFAKQGAAFAKERAAFERSSAKARQQIAAKLAALQAQSELYAHTSELPAHSSEQHDRFVADFTKPEVVDEIVEDSEGLDEILTAPEEPITVADEDEVLPTEPVAHRPMMQREILAPTPMAARSRPTWLDRVRGNRVWRRAGVGAVATILLAATVFAAGRGRDRRPTPSVAQAQGVRLVDSVAGGVGSPLAVIDSAALVPAVDSVPTPRPRRERPARRPVVAPLSDSARAASATDSATRRDTLFGALPFAVAGRVSRDSVMRGDTASRRDTTARRDTSRSRPDSVTRRDSLPRPDSNAATRGEAP